MNPQHDTDGAAYHRIIRPRCALTARRVLGLFAAYFALETALGIQFANTGAWIISLFIGIEILFVSSVIVVMASTRRNYESVVIDPQRLTVCRRVGKREWCDQFPRGWARITLERDRTGWYPSRLWVGSHGRLVEIGHALTDSAREALALDLREHLRIRPD